MNIVIHILSVNSIKLHVKILMLHERAGIYHHACKNNVSTVLYITFYI